MAHNSRYSHLWDDDIEEYPPGSYPFMYKDYLCYARRNNNLAWCGYCLLPDKHVAYNYDIFDLNLKIHGGITYTNGSGLFGFDCMHDCDIAPRNDDADIADRLNNIPGCKYWKHEEVVEEIKKMVDCFIELDEEAKRC